MNSEVKSFVKRPIKVEAIQWTGANFDDIHAFVGDKCSLNKNVNPHELMVNTREGNLYASIGDWIIRGIYGEFYPCKPDIFAMTYKSPDEDTSKYPMPDVWKQLQKFVDEGMAKRDRTISVYFNPETGVSIYINSWPEEEEPVEEEPIEDAIFEFKIDAKNGYAISGTVAAHPESTREDIYLEIAKKINLHCTNSGDSVDKTVYKICMFTSDIYCGYKLSGTVRVDAKMSDEETIIAFMNEYDIIIKRRKTDAYDARFL